MASLNGDRPRKVIIANPAQAKELQRGLVEQGTTDVLVTPNKLVPEGTVYVVENPSIIFGPDHIGPSSDPAPTHPHGHG